jgi:uncharacterized protein YciI
MKTYLSKCIWLALAVAFLSGSAVCQEAQKYDMGKMQMVFLSQDPAWKTANEKNAARIKQEHDQHIGELIKAGKTALAGPVKGPGSLREILVFKTESADEALQFANAFPAVKFGMYKVEILPWFAAKNYINQPQMPLAWSPYIFGLLVRGDKWTATASPEATKIQEGHMANINKLGESGKLVLAGPFYEPQVRRGVFIFKVPTLDEAQKLTDTDPAVMAGRLKIELYEWSVPTGVLK